MLIARPRAIITEAIARISATVCLRLIGVDVAETDKCKRSWKLRIELKTFIVALPSGDGNSRAEFDWNLARGSEKERERENLQGSAFGYACSSNSRIEFSRCFRSFTVIVCHELSLEMVTLDFALWPGPMLQGEIFGSLPLSVSNIDSSSSRRFFEIRSISCIYRVRIDLSLLRCLKFVGDDLFIYNCTDWKIFADC